MIPQCVLLFSLCGLSLAQLDLVNHGLQPAHEHHAPKPYKFGYIIKDKHGEQHREESGTGGHHVTGSYGFTDARGVHRLVNYVADKAGFRAQIKTNEPGTASQNPAAVHMISSAPNTFDQGYLGVPAAIGYGLQEAGLVNGGLSIDGGLGALGYTRYGY